MSDAHEHTNQLIEETSPYLLQHAHNPVDWRPWGEEAFRIAREEDKPVLLSIGYSACHWCHVMERESFEDESIAGLMNREFVNIKVDREERPDVDSIYMDFVQMATGAGGWPLTVFLSPDQAPFFGGTYFPPDDRYGRPGFRRILQSLADAYRSKRDELERNREETVRRLHLAGSLSTASSLTEGAMPGAATELMRHHDPAYGGFGSAPKFPSSMVLGFLLRHASGTGDKAALEAVELSLTSMACGGIYDHVGGGFHRYSVDERWLVPHFEKMLYDNALLVRLYLEAYQVTANPLYREVAEETLEWVIREMTDPEGGFYSALDADSEGVEGKYYLWTPEEACSILGGDSASFCDYYDISEGGNFEGLSIPHPRYEIERFAQNGGHQTADLKERFRKNRRQLLEARFKRIRPGLDDKILAAWNGMMLTAFSEAAWVLDRADFLEVAMRNAEFLDSRMFVEGRLKRTWKNGSARLNSYLEDYALVAEGWIALYQASGDVGWLERARELTDRQVELYWDDSEGAFFFTSNDHEKLLVRQKEFMDNATPSGNSVSCFNLLKLAILTGNREDQSRAERLLERVGGVVDRQAQAFGYWLQALAFKTGPVSEIVILGAPGQRALLEGPLRSRFLPNKVLVLADDAPSQASLVPLLEGKSSPPDRATAFVCRDFVCREPVTTAKDLERVLDRSKVE